MTEDADSDVSTVRDAHAAVNGRYPSSSNEPVTDGQTRALSDLPCPPVQAPGADAASSSAKGENRSLEAYGVAIGHAFAADNTGSNAAQSDLSAALEYDLGFHLGSREFGSSLDDYFTFDFDQETSPDLVLNQDWPENVTGMEDVRF